VRIGLLTEGGYPYVSGDARLWCDRLVRGLARHEFHVYALSRSRRQEDEGLMPLPPQVTRVRTAPLWTAVDDGTTHGRDLHGRRARRRFLEAYAELAGAVCEVGRGGDGAGRPPGGGTDGRTCGCADGCANGCVSGCVGDCGDAGAGGYGDDRQADRFGNALYALADLAREEGGLGSALRSEGALRVWERACRAPGAVRPAHGARVAELLAVARHVERTLRPLSLDWYEDAGLGAVDLCHATAGGPAALPALLARHFSGVPLLVTEYGVPLRAHYLTTADAPPAVRALLASFHRRLAAEVYRRAARITAGNAHVRRWQEHCGADRAKLRTVYPGMEASRFAEVAGAAEVAEVAGVAEASTADEHGGAGADAGRSADGPGSGGGGGRDGGGRGRDGGGEADTLVWVGRVEPAKDLVSLLHAFAAVRTHVPTARLRIVGAAAGVEGRSYLDHCESLAARLFPDDAPEGAARTAGDRPVSFEEAGAPGAPDLAAVYAAGAVVVLSSVVEGFPVSLVEAMFCARATVSTDVGAVVEVIGGTGLVVPPREPVVFAQACVALLRDPERRRRLGEAARARALELFTVEQNVMTFDGLYLDVVSHFPRRRVLLDDRGTPLPFGTPAEAHLPGDWTGSGRPRPLRRAPVWASDTAVPPAAFGQQPERVGEGAAR
jgi:glycosyltransferase involved in cell wall biosynthesis